MQSSTFLVRAITFNPVTSPLFILGQFLRTCSEGQAIATELDLIDAKAFRDETEQLVKKSKRTEMKALLTVLVGVSSLIVATQLTLLSFEQIAPSSIADPATETVQIYTPPNLGAPARTFGSATR